MGIPGKQGPVRVRQLSPECPRWRRNEGVPPVGRRDPLACMHLECRAALPPGAGYDSGTGSCIFAAKPSMVAL